jgi:hypothetical protein
MSREGGPHLFNAQAGRYLYKKGRCELGFNYTVHMLEHVKAQFSLSIYCKISILRAGHWVVELHHSKLIFKLNLNLTFTRNVNTEKLSYFSKLFEEKKTVVKIGREKMASLSLFLSKIC